MVKITPEIITALHQVKISLPHAVNKALADKIGITEASVSRMLTGQCKEVRSGTWKRIKPLIAPYMSPETLRMAEQGIQYPLSAQSIPPELKQDLEHVAEDLDVPISSMVPALLKALIRAHKEGDITSIWPPRLDVVPKVKQD